MDDTRHVPEEFAHPVERELAHLLDEHGVRWEYEPHTFVLARDDDDNVTEAFTPDFFLPDLGIYVECTVMRRALAGRKRRKARRVTEIVGRPVAILYRRDFERIARRWRLHGLMDAVRPEREVSSTVRAGTRP